MNNFTVNSPLEIMGTFLFLDWTSADMEMVQEWVPGDRASKIRFGDWFDCDLD